MDSNFRGVSSSGQILGVAESLVNPLSPLPQLIPGQMGDALWLNRDTIHYGKHAGECFYHLNLCNQCLGIYLIETLR